MKPRLCLAVLIIGRFLIPAMAQEPVRPHIWKTYSNIRFQYSICYPDDLFKPLPEPSNADGRRFSASGGAQLIVFGRNNALNQSPQEIMDDSALDLAGKTGKITYKAVKPGWFVISGVNAPTIFYEKTLLSHDQVKSFELTYSESEASVWRPIVSRIASCFSDLAR